MPWSEVRPGHHQRPIGENERFIKAIGDRAHPSGREHWSITSKALFKLTRPSKSVNLSTKLHRTWKKLRHAHPSIASTADENTLNYIVPDIETLEMWLKETFFIHEGNTSVDDMIANFRPSPYVTAHYFPESSQLLLHSAHWRTDGFGALQLLDAFFNAFTTLPDQDPANLPWGQEVERLVPSIEEVLRLPYTATPEIHAAANRYISSLAHTKGAIGVFHRKEKTTLPGGTRSARLRLSQRTTTAILETCATHSISALSAVHASLAETTYASAPPDMKGKHYTSTMRFGLRPYLPEPYGTAQFASALYTGGYMFKVPASQSWLENAKQFNEEYQGGVTEEFLQARRQYALNVQALMQKNVPADGPPPSEIDISSVDDTELLVHPVQGCGDGALEVLEVSIGVETLTRQMYCFVWTFCNQMEFNLVYNEAFYDQTFAVGILEKLKEVLEIRLDI
ncbi:hypothetical protein P7C71_g939, partial [Lecanoromycetidae sp. Uapishka_2]